MIVLGFLLIAIGVILILMISSFQSKTRQNFRVISKQVKRIQQKLDEMDFDNAVEKKSSESTSEKPADEKPSLQTSGQRYVPKAVQEQSDAKKKEKDQSKEQEKSVEQKKQTEVPPLRAEKKPEITKEPVQREKPKVAATDQKKEKLKKTAFHGTTAKPKKQERDFEKLIGENWLNKIGIAVLVIGLGFFVKYAIDRDWIGEMGRVGIGMACGGALIAIAHFLREKYRAFSSVLIGGGISVFYYTIFIAYQDYQLFSQAMAFSIMVGITILSTFLSVLYDRKELAIIALVGGFTTPFMVKGEHDNYIAFFTYLAILNAGFMVLSYFKKWNVLSKLALGFTVLFFGSWMIISAVQHAPKLTPAILFSCLFFVEFIGMSLVYNLSRKEKFNAFEFIQLLGITSLFYGGMMYLLSAYDSGNLQGIFTLGLSVLFFVLTFMAKSIKGTDDALIKLLTGKVVTLITLSFFVLFEGNYATFFWAIEAVLLLWIGQRAKMPVLKSAAVLVLFIGGFTLIKDWLQLYFIEDHNMMIIANKAFYSSVVVILANTVFYFLLGREEEDGKLLGIQSSSFKMLIGGWLMIGTYLALFFEILQQVERIPHEEGQSVVLWLFQLIFIGAATLIAHLRKKELLEQIFMLIGVFLLVVYCLVGHQNSIDLRNAVLDGEVPGLFYQLRYLLVGLLVCLAVLLRKASLRMIKQKNGQSAFLMFLSIVGMFVLSTELDHFGVYYFAENSSQASTVLRHTQGAGYTVLWGVYSFVLMIYGMRKSDRFIRIFSLTVFMVTIGKLFIYDIRSVSEAGKIAAFISLGVLLLVISFLYQKLRNLIVDGSFERENQEDIKSEEETESKSLDDEKK